MKTFSQLMMEVAQPKSEDELNFKLKHEIEFIDHPASEEGQHTSDKKKAKRIADYDTGEDMAVNEENLDEEEMTDDQMKRREEIVKGMKKNKADLEKRYGDKWKEVMYATATKQAMGESVDLDESVDKKELKKAQELGKQAFKDGIRRQPPLDRELGKLIDANNARRDLKLQTPFMKAWMKGWDTENLKEGASENALIFNAIQKKKMQKEELGLDEGFKSGVMKLKDKSEVKLSGDDVSALNKLFDNVSAASASKMKMSMMKDKKGFDEILSFAREAM